MEIFLFALLFLGVIYIVIRAAIIDAHKEITEKENNEKTIENNKLIKLVALGVIDDNEFDTIKSLQHEVEEDKKQHDEYVEFTEILKTLLDNEFLEKEDYAARIEMLKEAYGYKN